jgi:RimJ/RimL family protein N-acetyltransferase
MSIPELQTERLLLRAFQDADLDAYAAMLADPEVVRYIGTGETATRDIAWRSMCAHLGHWQLRGYGNWAAVERATGRLVGRIGCWNPEGWPGFEIGWTLGREYWGRGFATEGARAALDFAFETLKVPRVISLIQPSNEKSIRVAERIGERPDGQVDLHGKPCLVYAIERGERRDSMTS